MSKKIVLIISFVFPPANDIGAIRMGKFAKYLPECGWFPVILTVDKIKDKPQTLPFESSKVEIIRTPYFTPSHFVLEKLMINGKLTASNHKKADNNYQKRNIAYNMVTLLRPLYSRPEVSLFIDEPWGWYFYAVKRGLEILKTRKVDLIYSTYSVATSHLIASRLHGLTGIPWVAEFRDPWSFNQYFKKIQPFHFLEMQLEKKIIKGAKYLISVSELLAKQLENFHSKKVFIIPNGFDEDDYKKDVPLTSKFIITFTGSIYPGRRNPEPLFEALRSLEEEGKIGPKDLEVRFFGQNCDWLQPLISQYSVENYVKVYGLTPYKDCIIRQKESTILLLLTWDNTNELTYSGKLFEYLGARRPILATAYKGGLMDELINESGCGIVANKPQEIKSVLENWINEWRKYKKIISYFKPNEKVISSYSRREQTKNLTLVFEQTFKNKQ